MRVAVCPTVSEVLDAVSFSEVTDCEVTVTAMVSARFLNAAMIFAVPTRSPVATPSESMLTTLGLLEVQVMGAPR